jgi:hypothetical protein
VVSELRGLAVRSAVQKRVADQETIRRKIEREIAKQYPLDALAKKGRAWARLGLLPPSVDLHETILQLYTGQLAGMYDPETKAMYLASWIPLPLQAGAVAHELVHALQDQHFDLIRYFEQVKGDSDAEAARQAVVEGEATAIMLDYQLRELGLSFTSLGEMNALMEMAMREFKRLKPGTSQAPPFLEAQMIFPYAQGIEFLKAVRQRMEWQEMAVLYQDPPASTEQILHPEKYLDRRDPPTAVRLPDLGQLLGRSWTKTDEDALGEFGVRELLAQFLDGSTAAAGAEGWDGDRYAFYERSDDTGQGVLVWASVWDSEADAQEFAQQYRAVIAKRYPDARTDSANGGAWQTADEEIRVAQTGSRVTVLQASHGLELDRLAAGLAVDR